jgi:hypothetical protein
MAALDSEEVKKALKNKLGCIEEVDGDHIRYSLWENGKLLSRTKISHGPRHTIGDTLVSKMSRQIKLGTNSNFVGMVSCSLSKEKCVEIIRTLASQ